MSATLVAIWIPPLGVGLLLLLRGFGWLFARLVLIFVLPLDFHGRLSVIRSKFIPGALHGIEASFLADASRSVSCALLSLRLSAPVVSLWPMSELCLVCWMGLRVVILLSV